MLERKISWNVLKFDLRTSILCWRYEYMKMCEYKRSRSLFDFFTQDSHGITVSNISSEATGPVVTKFYVEPSGAEGAKICSNCPGHITNMVAMPIGSKNL